MRFFTSDTHFNHARILELGQGRPFDAIEDHNEALIANWNSVVSAEDTVYHLGDVALGPWPDGLAMVSRLNGYKVLIPGNHDRISSTEKSLRRAKFMRDYSDVFQYIVPEVFSMLIDSQEVVLSHYPYDGDSHERDRFDDIRPWDLGRVLIHGHTHSESNVSFSKNGTLQISVGVDSNNFTPVSETKIINLMRSYA